MLDKHCVFLPFHVLFLLSPVSLLPDWTFRDPTPVSDLAYEQDRARCSGRIQIKLLVRSIEFGWGENMNYIQLSEKDLVII